MGVTVELGETGAVTVTVMPMTPADPGFGQAAVLFDEYRRHYGQAASLDASGAWLEEQVIRQRVWLAAAVDDTDRLCGFITTTVVPASLALGTAWSIRDLYVAPGHRRAGIAYQLLHHVIAEARNAGALRVSLQTEFDNTPAIMLYTAAGFRQVGGLMLLNLTLTPDDTT
jgi:GNAT superfamily N-acetyltransferase